jgi:hypothetical protein
MFYYYYSYDEIHILKLKKTDIYLHFPPGRKTGFLREKKRERGGEKGNDEYRR